ncbi:hypothetical protein CC2G_004673 [Coprinopsis cinerea AmutBmut pab1-1]|nr:hypothetical protein CC2G_004673 [Coprinopsis cinerea AmutBmut pab1-1]
MVGPVGRCQGAAPSEPTTTTILQRRGARPRGHRNYDMADEACSIAAIACLDIVAGCWVDFISIRHACTENLCRSQCYEESPEPTSAERRPLLASTTDQPRNQPDMPVPSSG